MVSSYNEFANQTGIIEPDFKADTPITNEISGTRIIDRKTNQKQFFVIIIN